MIAAAQMRPMPPRFEAPLLRFDEMAARRAHRTRTPNVDGRERNGLSLRVPQKGRIYERRHAPGKVMFGRQPAPNLGLRTGGRMIVGMLSR
jgi:hypothetical protein